MKRGCGHWIVGPGGAPLYILPREGVRRMGGLLRRKTFWGGIGSIATGIVMILGDNAAEGVQLIVVGILAIFGRAAIAKME